MKNKDKFVICKWCANSACGICEKGEYFVPKGIEHPGDSAEIGGSMAVGTSFKERYAEFNCEQSSGEADIEHACAGGININNKQYRSESIVSKRSDKIDEIVDAHWNYVKCVIESGADVNKMFTFDEVMKIRKWDYCSAARHFYGHGYEDGKADIGTE